MFTDRPSGNVQISPVFRRTRTPGDMVMMHHCDVVAR